MNILVQIVKNVWNMEKTAKFVPGTVNAKVPDHGKVTALASAIPVTWVRLVKNALRVIIYPMKIRKRPYVLHVIILVMAIALELDLSNVLLAKKVLLCMLNMVAKILVNISFILVVHSIQITNGWPEQL